MKYLTAVVLLIGGLALAFYANASDDGFMDEELKRADTNQNGTIEAEEVNRVIEGYLTGDLSWSESSINRLIDHCLETH